MRRDDEDVVVARRQAARLLLLPMRRWRRRAAALRIPLARAVVHRLSAQSVIAGRRVTLECAAVVSWCVWCAFGRRGDGRHGDGGYAQ